CNALRLGDSDVLLGLHKLIEPVQDSRKGRWTWPPLIAVYTRPFLRVALSANVVKRHYKQFTEADVTSGMIAPEIHVYAASQHVEGTAIANVETIVVLPYNSKDDSQAVH